MLWLFRTLCCEDTILWFGSGVQWVARTEGGTERNAVLCWGAGGRKDSAGEQLGRWVEAACAA